MARANNPIRGALLAELGGTAGRVVPNVAVAIFLPCVSRPAFYATVSRPVLAPTLLCVLILSAFSADARPFYPKVNGLYPARNAAQRVEAESVIIVDNSSGRVVAAKNANQLRQAASLQKLVTALVIAEAGNLDKLVTVTAGDANCPRTRLPKSVGGSYTRRELLQAMLVVSANDAARALARDNSGIESWHLQVPELLLRQVAQPLIEILIRFHNAKYALLGRIRNWFSRKQGEAKSVAGGGGQLLIRSAQRHHYAKLQGWMIRAPRCQVK